MKDETLDLLTPFMQKAIPVGSRVTCAPAPMDTDYDVLVLLNDQDLGSTNLHPVLQLEAVLTGAGWDLGGSLPDNALEDKVPALGSFSSYTKGEENLIVTCDLEFYRRFLAATKVSKQLNLLEKSDRIALFQAVLYGNGWQELDVLAPPSVHPPAYTMDDFDDLI